MLLLCLQVDVYGKCGKLKCGRGESVQQQIIDTNTRCDETISHYKFYLAFENTLCPDYVTEKFFRTLTLGETFCLFILSANDLFSRFRY